MNEKITVICTDMINGKLSFEAFYDKLTTISEDTRTDEDTACLLEDVLMELEMISSETKSPSSGISYSERSLHSNLSRMVRFCFAQQL